MDEHTVKRSGGWLDILVFILFLNIFFFHAFEIVALGCFLAGLWILLVKLFAWNKNIGQIVWWESGVMAIIIGLLLLVDSFEKIILLVLSSLTLMLISTYTWLKQRQVGGLLELGLSSLVVIKEYFHSALLIVQGTFDGTLWRTFQLDQSKKKSSPWLKSIVVGGLVSLPLLAWLVMTLTQADPVFATFVRGILSENALTDLPSRLIFSFVGFTILAPLLLIQWRGYNSPLGWLSKVNWAREVTVVTSLVAVVLGIFLVVQWPYVFVNVSQETDLAKFGVATYSEYVQKGFWDLLKVVLMVFGVSWIGVLLNRNQSGQEKRILLGVQALLGLEFAIFILSIFRRVWLYQSYHGFSLARLYGLAVLVLIVGMTITMALRYLSRQVKWVQVEMAWLVFMVIAVIGINMEALVVKHPPTVNNRVDYVYLARLPGDGYEGWVKSYLWAKDVLAKYTQQTGNLGKDDRREIYYAGAVARQLTRNYHLLILRYGTEAEVKEYFRQVIVTKKDILTKTSTEDLIDTSGNKKQPRKEAIALLNESLADLDHADWLTKIDITPAYDVREMAYWYKEYPHQDRDVTYYALDRGPEDERKQGLDVFFSWSPIQNKIYRQMRQEIGEENLLTLQKQEMALQQRIGLQPETEREVEIDISLDSPFLQ